MCDCECGCVMTHIIENFIALDIEIVHCYFWKFALIRT